MALTLDDLTLVSLWIHVPLVTAWIGLVIFDVIAMLAPGLDLRQRAHLLAWSRPFVPIAIPVIIATGVWQTIHNPLGDIPSIAALEALRERTAYGQALFWKHGCVLATFALTTYVHYRLVPRLSMSVAAPTSHVMREDIQLERSVLWLSLLNAGACLGALLLATRMVWSLH